MRFVLCLFALAACDRVYQLERTPPQCPLPDLGDDDADDDFDGIGNAEDSCPIDENPRQHDEDGDGVGDECDLCAAGESDAPSDVDCDGIGDDCDPDDSVRHHRLFLGFGDEQTEIVVSGGDSSADLFEDDFRIHHADNDFGFVWSTRAVPQNGVYTTTFEIDDLRGDEWGIQLAFGALDDMYPQDSYYARIVTEAGLPYLELGQQTGPTRAVLERKDLGQASLPTGTYTLTVITSAAATRAMLAGPVIDTLSAIGELGAIDQLDRTRFGLSGYGVGVRFRYLERIGER